MMTSSVEAARSGSKWLISAWGAEYAATFTPTPAAGIFMDNFIDIVMGIIMDIIDRHIKPYFLFFFSMDDGWMTMTVLGERGIKSLAG